MPGFGCVRPAMVAQADMSQKLENPREVGTVSGHLTAFIILSEAADRNTSQTGC